MHTRDYVRRFRDGALDAAELRRLGFPWSEALVERSYRAVGGTIAAARHALHARARDEPRRRDASRLPRSWRRILRVQRRRRRDPAAAARGTRCVAPPWWTSTFIRATGRTRSSPAIRDVFTFSMHGGRNYPFHKVAGTLDVELADGTGDDVYLGELAAALPRVLAASAPDLVVYIAGADPHEGDRLGRLALTFDGLARRDAMVLDLLSRGRDPGRDHDRRRLRPSHRGHRRRAPAHGSRRARARGRLSAGSLKRHRTLPRHLHECRDRAPPRRSCSDETINRSRRNHSPSARVQ